MRTFFCLLLLINPTAQGQTTISGKITDTKGLGKQKINLPAGRQGIEVVALGKVEEVYQYLF